MQLWLVLLIMLLFISAYEEIEDLREPFVSISYYCENFDTYYIVTILTEFEAGYVFNILSFGGSSTILIIQILVF